VYGIIVGILFSTPFHIGSFYLTPELSLILGNIFAFTVSGRTRVKLALAKRTALSSDIYEFDFIPDEKFVFIPGQYMEWTMYHKNSDVRGSRRFFTIASSPTEEKIKLAIRLAKDRSSSFKTALMNLKEGEGVFASHVMGEFVLPIDKDKNIVLVAGGIGITPFRSMIKHLHNLREKRNITLFYVSNNPESFVYMDVFNEASESVGLKTVRVLSGAKDIPADWNGETGFITPDMLKKYVSEFTNSLCYISGPSAMVQSYKKMLIKEGVNSGNIHTDYFPGY
jgi:glycine betaine catabolism B